MTCPSVPFLLANLPRGSAAPAALGHSQSTDDNPVPVATAAAEVIQEQPEPTTWAKSSGLSWWGPDTEWLVFDEPNDISLDPSERLRRNDFLQSLGDYAGRLFNQLKTAASAQGLSLPIRVVQLRDKLTEESLDDSRVGPTIKVLGKCVSFLREQNLDVNLQMAKLAILVYSKRNLLCHAKVGDPAIAKDKRRLNQVIDSDKTRLRELLPECQYQYCEDWRKIMQFYVDSQDRQQSNRPDPKDSPVKVLQEPNLQLLPIEEREAKFIEGVARSRVQVFSRTIEDRKPITPPALLDRRKRAISDLLPYRPLKRSASRSPKGDGADGKDDKFPHPPTVDALEAVDVQDLQGLQGDLLTLYRMNRARGRQALRGARQIVEQALQNQSEAEEASARKRARKERKASRRG